MRVFLDTNVIVSALATRGLCADVVRAVLAGHQLVISEALMGEVASVLRDKFGLSSELISEVLGLFRDGAILAESSPSSGLPLLDPPDRILLAAALRGKADVFVTGDRELIEIRAVGPLAVVSPRTFWEMMKTRPPV